MKARVHRLRGSLAATAGLLRRAAGKFQKDRGTLMAAAVSFYALLSLLPLLLLGVAVFGHVVGSSEKAFETVVGFFRGLVPAQTFVEDTLRNLVRARGVIGGIGLLILLWTGSQLFVTLESALDVVWEIAQPPGFFRSRVKAVLMVLISGLFLLISVGSTSLLAIARGGRLPLAGISLGEIPYLWTLATTLLSLLFTIAMFLVIYRWVPSANVPWGPALLGAVAAGIVWELAKQLYRLYLSHLGNFDVLYGSLGSVIILILWIYYSAMILIFGAELAHARQQGVERSSEMTG